MSSSPSSSPSSAPSSSPSSPSSSPSSSPRPTVVLVHGSFADASGFAPVIGRLQARGFPTLAPVNPLRSLETDTAYLRGSLDTIDGPVVLVAHSYGGMVASNAATGTSNVKALVYVNAFAPAPGEAALDLAYKFPGSMLTPANLTVRPCPTPDPSQSGQEASINADVFTEAFAADVDPSLAAAMAVSQRPIDFASLQQPSGAPAWASTPSWFVIGTEDNTIPPELHRFMAERADAVRTVELTASHVLMLSKPDEVVEVIVEAAEARR